MSSKLRVNTGSKKHQKRKSHMAEGSCSVFRAQVPRLQVQKICSHVYGGHCNVVGTTLGIECTSLSPPFLPTPMSGGLAGKALLVGLKQISFLSQYLGGGQHEDECVYVYTKGGVKCVHACVWGGRASVHLLCCFTCVLCAPWVLRYPMPIWPFLFIGAISVRLRA